MRPNQLRRLKEKQRLRAKRAWDSGRIQRHIALRDRSEDDALRAKLDRKGQMVFVAALPDGTKLRVEWSRHGRTDQWDLVDQHQDTFTARPDRIVKELACRSAQVSSCLKYTSPTTPEE